MPLRPNIVYILADDMGYGDLSCQNADSKIATPRLDEIASRGMRFTDAHACSSLCTPSRYGILTGRYAWRGRLQRGVLLGYSRPLLEPGRLTVARLLKDHGYDTACVGKWHLGWDWARSDSAPPAGDAADPWADVEPRHVDFARPIASGPTTAGFDWFFGISASLDMAPYCYVENDRVTAVPDATIDDSPWDAFWRAGPISPDFRHADVLPTLADRAVRYVRSRAGEPRPFFLYLPLTAPHTPILPMEAFRGRSQAGDYGDFVVQCDHLVGQVFDALRQTGQADNTLLIFTSDNGAERIAYQRALRTGHWSMGPLRGLKRDLWDGGHRVPMVAHWPGQVAAASLCGRTVCLTDLLATAAEMVGANLPADAGEDSLSMLGLLRGASAARSGRDALIHHSGSGRFAIRKGDWVLIDAPTGDDNGKEGEPDWFRKQRGCRPHDQPRELFNLNDDLAEANNLHAAKPDKAHELKAALEEIKLSGRSVRR